MNIKRIIQEEIEDLQWIKGVSDKRHKYGIVLLEKDYQLIYINANSVDELWEIYDEKYDKGLDPMLYSIDDKVLKGFSGIEPKTDVARKMWEEESDNFQWIKKSNATNDTVDLTVLSNLLDGTGYYLRRGVNDDIDEPYYGEYYNYIDNDGFDGPHIFVGFDDETTWGELVNIIDSRAEWNSWGSSGRRSVVKLYNNLKDIITSNILINESDDFGWIRKVPTTIKKKEDIPFFYNKPFDFIEEDGTIPYDYPFYISDSNKKEIFDEDQGEWVTKYRIEWVDADGTKYNTFYEDYLIVEIVEGGGWVFRGEE